MMNRKKAKPSEYPDVILKSLVKAYDDMNNNKARAEGFSFTEILGLAGMRQEYTTGDIDTKEIYNYLHDLRTSGYIYESGYADSSQSYKLTREGICYAYWLMRPWYRKAFDFMKGDVRTIVISVITALIITVATFFVLRALN
jgi:hypothetical protein